MTDLFATPAFWAVLLFWVLVYGSGIFGFVKKIRGLDGRDIRKKESTFERIASEGIDLALPIGNPRKQLETVFAFGKRQPQRLDGLTVFRTTAGWRYGMIVVIGFMLVLLTQNGVGTGVRETPYGMFFMIVALLSYSAFYLWVFRLELNGSRMVCTTLFLRAKEFDLAQLDSARETQDGYKLRFSDGTRVTVPLFLEGLATFKKMVVRTLEINGR